MATIKIKRTKKNDKQKVKINFSGPLLDKLLKYAISTEKEISKGNLVNMRKLWDIIDIKQYERDHLKLAKVKFIGRILENRITKGLEDRVILLESSKSKRYEDVEEDLIEMLLDEEDYISPKDIKMINTMVTEKLQYGFIFTHKDQFQKLFIQLEEGDYETIDQMKMAFQYACSGLLTDIKRADRMNEAGKIFSLVEDIFVSSVERTANKIKAASNTLKTRITWLNEMIDGGFASQRIYLFLGLSGGFKSGTLLNMAYDIKMANAGYKSRTKGSIPTILYITQENSVEETVDRLFSLCVADNTQDRMRNYTKEEAVKLLQTKGKLKLNKENNIDILLMYKAPGSIDTQDVDGIIDELEEGGAEIICLIHDYIKKIRSARPASDVRVELGYAVDELKAIANERDIPIITASQLNREGARAIDESMETNQADLARKLGVSNIGESWNMIENADLSIIVQRERMISTNVMYLTFKRVKLRNGPDDSIDYFNHPFASNEFGLLPDSHLNKPLSRKFLSDTLVAMEDEDDDATKFEKFGNCNGQKRDNIDKKDDDKNKGYSLTDINVLFDKVA